MRRPGAAISCRQYHVTHNIRHYLCIHQRVLYSKKGKKGKGKEKKGDKEKGKGGGDEGGDKISKEELEDTCSIQQLTVLYRTFTTATVRNSIGWGSWCQRWRNEF